MIEQGILDSLRRMPLGELVEIYEVLANRLHEHRQKHNGFVPRELFLPWLKLAGVYYCCDVIVRSADGKFLLKRRGGGEINPAMIDKYQIVGPAGVDGQSSEQVLTRALYEIFGKTHLLVQKYLPRVEYRFPEIHPEPWRSCTCLTLVFELWLDADDREYLDGTWEAFIEAQFGDPRIVRHQAETLEYYLSADYEQGKFVTLPGSPD